MSNSEIDMVIATLNSLQVSGEDNMMKIIGLIQFLRGHKMTEEVETDGND